MGELVSEIFTSFQDYLNTEQELREEIRNIVKDIEQAAREILTTLQKIHHEGGMKEIHWYTSAPDQSPSYQSSKSMRFAVIL